MRAATRYFLFYTFLTLFVACIGLSVSAGPTVVFQPDNMTITPGGTFLTPPIVVQNATGVTLVNLEVAVPSDISISAGLSGGNLLCVTQGSDVGAMFFSEWNAGTRKISVTCSVNAGSTVEIVRSIQFSTSASAAMTQLGLSGTTAGGSGAPLFGSLTLIPPHAIRVTSCTVSPAEVDSGATTQCAITAADSMGHAMTYAWSDGNRGGAFTPGPTAQNPSYTAPANSTGATVSVPLACVVTCTDNGAVTTTGNVALAVRSVPSKAVQIASTPNTGASISFAPTPDTSGQASPKPAPCTLSFVQTTQGIQLTASKQDGAARPLWFSHWSLDGVNQASGVLTVTFNMGGTNHTVYAVYGKPVGDLNDDGRVDKEDAHIVMRAVLGEAAQTGVMDVDMNGVVNLNDARWILMHRS